MHIYSQRSNNKSLSHGNAWKFASALTAKVGGEGILFPWSGVFTCIHMKEAFHRGLSHFALYLDQLQGNYIGCLDLLLLIIYRAIPEK